MGLCVIYFLAIVGTVFANYNRSMLQQKYPGFGDKYIPMSLDDGRVVIGYFENPLEGARISFSTSPESGVTFTYYSRNNRNGTVVRSSDNLTNIIETDKPIKFVTHGWLSSGDADTCILIRDGFLEKYDANVVVMDWSKISDNVIYPIPMRSTTEVGKFFGKFLNSVVDLGVAPENIHLVGHSLGAHVSGFAAREVKSGRIGRITGLDPALPGFDMGLVEGGHLVKEDAHFVDVIHTSGGFLGMQAALGHADFYPNGGTPPQPGCGNIIEMIEACSHGRSWQFFAASLVTSKPFMAYNCTSFSDYIENNACVGDAIPMGDPTPPTARGDYYLKTEWKPSFA